LQSKNKEDDMPRIALMIGVALLVAIGLGTWISGEEQPTEPSAPPILVGEPGVEYLEQALAEEREARIALEDTLAMLFEELERLEGTDERTAARIQAVAENERQARAAERRGQRDEADWMRSYQERRVATLIEGGFSEEDMKPTGCAATRNGGLPL
jgi:hypothetical protein